MSTATSTTQESTYTAVSTEAREARQYAEDAYRALREAQEAITERLAELSAAERLARIAEHTADAARQEEERLAQAARIAEGAAAWEALRLLPGRVGGTLGDPGDPLGRRQLSQPLRDGLPRLARGAVHSLGIPPRLPRLGAYGGIGGLLGGARGGVHGVPPF